MAVLEPKRPFFLAGKKRKKVITITGCLFLATVFWFFNALNNDYSAVIKYPIKVNYNPDDFGLNSISNNYVKLSANGYGWYLLYYSLGIGISPISVDLNQLSENIFIPNYKLLELAKLQLQNIEVKGIVSDSFKIAGEIKLSKKVYLFLDTSNLEVPAGKHIENVQINPNPILCKGLKSEILTLPDSFEIKLRNAIVNENYKGKALVFFREFKNIRQNTAYVNVSFELR